MDRSVREGRRIKVQPELAYFHERSNQKRVFTRNCTIIRQINYIRRLIIFIYFVSYLQKFGEPKFRELLRFEREFRNVQFVIVVEGEPSTMGNSFDALRHNKTSLS